jgi:hypothetical protein
MNLVEVGFASKVGFRQSQSLRCSTTPSHKDDGGGWHLLSGWNVAGKTFKDLVELGLGD